MAKPPLPQTDDTVSVIKALLDGQSALLQGVNDLRANVVTRKQLQEFHELQASEMRTYVQAELEPIHNTLRHHSAHVGSIADRVARVESRVDAEIAVQEARPEIHDPHVAASHLSGSERRLRHRTALKPLRLSCEIISLQ